MRIKHFVSIVGFYLLSQVCFAETVVDNQEFEKIFTDWSDAFNHKNLAATCHLFAKNVIANYQGFSQRNYSDICSGFNTIFNQINVSYQYKFKLQNVYQQANLAVVRITWYLQVYKRKKLISSIQDEGMDVFSKSKDGHWEIINYISYPVPE
jgi:ketosteroid isomerase-like protein